LSKNIWQKQRLGWQPLVKKQLAETAFRLATAGKKNSWQKQLLG
jgi:hypothetical protein